MTHLVGDSFGRRFSVLARALMACGAAATLAAGCAGTETPNPALAADGAPRASEPIPRGKARLSLTRVSGLLYSGVPASVKVNGQPVAELWAGGASSVDLAPGPTAVSVDAWSHPGSWTVELNVKAGQTYALEISPRGDSYVPGALFGVVGAAIDANVNKNAGAFQMRVVSAPEGGKT